MAVPSVHPTSVLVFPGRYPGTRVTCRRLRHQTRGQTTDSGSAGVGVRDEETATDTACDSAFHLRGAQPKSSLRNWRRGGSHRSSVASPLSDARLELSRSLSPRSSCGSRPMTPWLRTGCNGSKSPKRPVGRGDDDIRRGLMELVAARRGRKAAKMGGRGSAFRRKPFPLGPGGKAGRCFGRAVERQQATNLEREGESSAEWSISFVRMCAIESARVSPSSWGSEDQSILGKRTALCFPLNPDYSTLCI